jgi:hypothetical protein
MLLSFEGIDGSGKTAVAKGVLERLIARGVDVRSLVLAERLLGTSEVLGYGPETHGLTSDVVPDLTILVDSDPLLARARGIVADIFAAEDRAAAGRDFTLALRHRLRRGYLRLARSAPDRWAIVDNDGPLGATIFAACTLIERALQTGIPASCAAFSAASSRIPHLVEPVVHSASMALNEVLTWIKRRSRSEPAVAAYWLSGWCGPRVDELRWALSPRAPRVMLQSLPRAARVAAPWCCSALAVRRVQPMGGAGEGRARARCTRGSRDIAPRLR